MPLGDATLRGRIDILPKTSKHFDEVGRKRPSINHISRKEHVIGTPLNFLISRKLSPTLAHMYVQFPTPRTRNEEPDFKEIRKESRSNSDSR